MTEDMRAAFEAWIKAPPYERSTRRLPATSAWPGQYYIDIQLAWEAWQEASRIATAAEGIDA